MVEEIINILHELSHKISKCTDCFWSGKCDRSLKLWTPILQVTFNYRTISNSASFFFYLHLIGEDYWFGGLFVNDLDSLHQVCPTWRAIKRFWSHLCMVLLQVDKLFIQTLNLYLKVWASHGEFVQNPSQTGDISLHGLTHGQFVLVPEAAKNNNG